ncbi:MAG TPA: DoxX family protein [Streptosporangiaceae bacterium]|jgi:putative oxidoreductase
MRPRPLYDIVALLARIAVGAVFIAHGWQKIQVGITSTSDQFAALDVPLPTAAAVYSTFVELLGGAALILGLGLPVAGVLLFIDMAGAFAFVNGPNGLFLVNEHGVAKNGFELVLVLGLVSLVFAVGGAGRITLDSRVFGRRSADDAENDPDWVSSLAPDPGEVSGHPAISAPEESHPASPEDPPKPAMPATTGGPTVPESAASPRLASDIVRGTTGDTLVAGRKKRRPGGKGSISSETQPIARRGKSAKDDKDKTDD